jgi:glycine oxidase
MTSDNFQSSRRNSADVVIVGGGVIGLSIARELARRGVRDIALCDQGEPGKEVSWAAAGILAPQVEANSANDFFQLACASRDLYPEFARELREETAVDVELDTTGTLFVGFTEDEESELRQRYDWQRRADLRVEWLDSNDVRSLEPDVSDQVRCALRFPDDWQVENRKLVEALIVSNGKLNVQLIPNCEVTSLRIDGNRVAGVETANGIITAPTILLCAGAWTSSVETSADAAAQVEIEPVRGQMLCFKPEQTIARHVVYGREGYLVPRRDGRVLAGSTSEHVGFDKRVTNEGSHGIRLMAAKFVPALASVPTVDSWAGFRPRASDDLPVLGPDSEIEGLFYATGHYRNGILLAPITAQVIADLLAGGSSSFIEAFSPNRFCATHA